MPHTMSEIATSATVYKALLAKLTPRQRSSFALLRAHDGSRFDLTENEALETFIRVLQEVIATYREQVKRLRDERV